MNIKIEILFKLFVGEVYHEVISTAVFTSFPSMRSFAFLNRKNCLTYLIQEGLVFK